ncbi:MAG: alpha/beta fold hydrolase [Candidatus Omnitrophica bacterium]|nr:alpha/beta fold hydrolase [Candidatus Omnitrophota bacterium]
MKQDAKTGIMYREWVSSSPKTVLLLVHGLGGHSLRWQSLSEFFQRNGVASYAIELRGFGETKGPAGHVDSFSVYIEDILRLRHIIDEEHPGARVYVAGESVGALLVFLVALSRPGLFSGLVCLSPALADTMRFSILDYLKIFIPLLYDPKKIFHLPFSSRMATRDTAYQEKLDEDKRERRFASSKFLFEVVVARWLISSERKKLAVPALFLVAGSDLISNPAASRKLFNGLKVADKKFMLYPEMHHALSIDVGREKVFEDMHEWIRDRS